MLRSALVLIAVAGGLAVPATASAVNVEKNGDDIFVTAEANEDNDIQITVSGPQILIQDFANPVDPQGGGCFVSGDAVRCPDVGLDDIIVDAGNGDNEVHAFAPYHTTIDGTAGDSNDFSAPGATSALLNGGPGPDTLVGGAGTDGLSGFGGNDVLNGGGSTDTLTGGPDSDTLVASAGADDFQGSGGIDTVTYAASAAPVFVSLDDDNNDGVTGEGDNVHSNVENVIGGSGNDEIVGSTSANTLTGNDGDDTLSGGAADDTLNGGDGDDDLNGDAENDTLNGDGDDDDLNGGVDDDTLNGHSGVDLLQGGFGKDTLRGGPFSDTLVGGRDDDDLDGEGGTDKLTGNHGADKLRGGSAYDEVDYAAQTQPVTVDLDGSNFDDGGESEGDSVGDDVEGVIGGLGADHLTGTPDNEKFIGGPGDDVIDDGGGVDIVVGNEGADTLDTLDGATDTVDCGGDLGTLSADPGDNVASCPVAPVADPPAGGGTGDPVAPGTGGGGSTPLPGNGAPAAPAKRAVLAIGPAAVRLDRKRDARIKLTCSSANCSGTLRLTRKVKGKTVVVGRARYSIAAGKSRVVKVRVSKTAVRRIGRRGLKVTATAGTSKRSITLKKGRR